jgi:hypothetical protein
MYPDDRVLVGVVDRKRDLDRARNEHWYRIPQSKVPRGVYAEYIALFLSSSAARAFGRSGVYYYGERRGLELVHRIDMLPDEPNHKRAQEVYYKVQLGDLEQRAIPITNPTNRPISFIYTTWDRFTQAQHIADLYSKNDYYVDRIYHALRDARIRPDRFWETEERETGLPAQVRILCERGTVIASTQQGDDVDVFLDDRVPDDEILRQIQARIQSKGGLMTLRVPRS